MNTFEDHTLEDHKLWKLMNEVWDALSDHFMPAVDHFTDTRQLDREIVSLLLAVLTCEPESIMIADLMVRHPYTAAEKFQARLAEAVEKGYLTEIEPGSFRFTDTGRRETQELISTARAVMVKVDPLPQEDSAHLTRLFDLLVHACLETPPPPEPWSIRSSYTLMPETEPPLPYVEQAITCLSAYREDAHLAAWQFAGMTATAFEVLTLLWRNEANSFGEVCEKLFHRGHPREIYRHALEELRERNFVTSPKTDWLVTEGGRLFRNQVEEDTERLFFVPWRELSTQEKTVMAGFLFRLKEGLLSRDS